jgi:hypothetical protein
MPLRARAKPVSAFLKRVQDFQCHECGMNRRAPVTRKHRRNGSPCIVRSRILGKRNAGNEIKSFAQRGRERRRKAEMAKESPKTRWRYQTLCSRVLLIVEVQMAANSKASISSSLVRAAAMEHSSRRSSSQSRNLSASLIAPPSLETRSPSERARDASRM